MPTANVSQNASITDPTDLSAVDNINAITTAGYGGPHAVFDKDHYKGQMRMDTKLVEFSALQGVLTGIGYVWAINLIAYNDNNVTEMMALPPTELVVINFFWNQMDVLIEKYFPKQFYFVALNKMISIEDYVKGTFP